MDEPLTHCYCQVLSREPYMLQCQLCKRFYHPGCLRIGSPSSLVGDMFFKFICSNCTGTGREVCERLRMQWMQVLLLTMYNLQLQGGGKLGYFRWREHICGFIDRHWNLFFGSSRKKTTTWHGTIAGALSGGANTLFRSGTAELGESGWWALISPLPPTVPEIENLIATHRVNRRSKNASSDTTPKVEGLRHRGGHKNAMQAAIELKEKRSTLHESRRRGNSLLWMAEGDGPCASMPMKVEANETSAYDPMSVIDWQAASTSIGLSSIKHEPDVEVNVSGIANDVDVTTGMCSSRKETDIDVNVDVSSIVSPIKIKEEPMECEEHLMDSIPLSQDANAAILKQDPTNSLKEIDDSSLKSDMVSEEVTSSTENVILPIALKRTIGRVTGYNILFKENIEQLPKSKSRFVDAVSLTKSQWSAMTVKEKEWYILMAQEQSTEAKLVTEKTENDRKYRCDKCPSKFSLRKTWKDHMKECGMTFICGICGKVMKQKRNVSSHVMKVHLQVRLHKCVIDGCGKSFTLKSHLSRHMTTHSGKKEHECQKSHDECYGDPWYKRRSRNSGSFEQKLMNDSDDEYLEIDVEDDPYITPQALHSQLPEIEDIVETIGIKDAATAKEQKNPDTKSEDLMEVIEVPSSPTSPEGNDKESDGNSSDVSETQNNDVVMPSSGRKRKAALREETVSTEVEQTKCVLMSIYEERLLLKKLEVLADAVEMNPKARRLRRKLKVRQIKRERNLPVFDFDVEIEKCGQTLSENERVPTPRIIASQARGYQILDRYQVGSITVKSGHLHRHSSFVTRLMGLEENQLESIVSPYTSRILKPFIFRDYESTPLKLQLLQEIVRYPHRNHPDWKPPPRHPIDYCYVRPEHVPVVNALCREFFWPGIDLSESLQYPDFSCIALYRKAVIGFAFMVPDVKYNEAYIPFLFTHPEWRKAGIATFMLYHLIQTCMGKDVTLHVSATNPSLFLYQKFGFKVEEFILDFYEKYFPADSRECRHAMFLRLSR